MSFYSQKTVTAAQMDGFSLCVHMAMGLENKELHYSDVSLVI